MRYCEAAPLFGLVWLLFNVPVNNFSVMLGRSHPGIYQYFGELNVSCSRTLHGGCGVRTLDLSLQSPTERKYVQININYRLTCLMSDVFH